jgi:hypothetical protein
MRTDVGIDGDKDAKEDQELDNVERQQISRAQIFSTEPLHKIKNCVKRECA